MIDKPEFLRYFKQRLNKWSMSDISNLSLLFDLIPSRMFREKELMKVAMLREDRSIVAFLLERVCSCPFSFLFILTPATGNGTTGMESTPIACFFLQD